MIIKLQINRLSLEIVGLFYFFVVSKHTFITKINKMVNIWGKLIMIASLLTLNFYSFSQQTVPLPTPAQIQRQNEELAALVCWDLHVHDGELYVQSKIRITPAEDYNIFNKKKYNIDRWIRTLKWADFKISILTVSHETGFSLHQNDATPYCMIALKWQDGKGDMLLDFKDLCEKYGILPDDYIGTRWNSFYGDYDFNVNGNNQYAKNRQQHYNPMIEKIAEGIFSNYGDWVMVWLDGGAHCPEQDVPDVLSVFEKYQPNSLIYHNLGTVPYCSPGVWESEKKEIGTNNFKLLKIGELYGSYYVPVMSDAPLCDNGEHYWFWTPERAHIIYPLENLVKIYYNSVGHNLSLILGIAPSPDGFIPEPDAKRFI